MVQNFDGVEADFLGHSSFLFRHGAGNLYIDPWSEVLDSETVYPEADVIVVTHDHHDHFDLDAINRLSVEETVIVCTEDVASELPGDLDFKIIDVRGNVVAKGLRFEGFPAYNTERKRDNGKPFHPEGFVVGLLFELDGVKMYYSSDTDFISEMVELGGEEIDVAFLPIGGTYTMDVKDAVNAVEAVKPGKVVPIHYNVVEGTDADPREFEEKIENSEVVIL